MAIRLLTLFALLVVGSGVVAWGFQDTDKQEPQEKPKQLDNRPFMERKLEAAKNIVSGLATEDFELIAKSASDLTLLSQESQWEVFQTDSYYRMSADFRESSTLLRDTARDKNLDGATLAYFEVTLNCVRCHKYIRTNPK
jgi:hypothetical protein